MQTSPASFEHILHRNNIKALSISNINKGSNAKSFKIISTDKNYFLKIYPTNSYEKESRLNAERSFLQLLNYSGNFDVPIYIDSCETSRSILMSWIDGQVIEAPTVIHWENYIDFLLRIQTLYSSSINYNVGFAKESSFSLLGHHLLVKRRLKEITNKISSLDKLKEFSQWLNESPKSLIDKEVLFSDLSSEEILYEIPFESRILSPSDIGFHNVIENNNRLYFIDFEYAGIDDPYKLLSDILIHPNYSLDEYKIKLILSKITPLFSLIGIDYKKLKLMLYLYIVKWVIIKLRPFDKINFNDKDYIHLLDSVKSYFNNKLVFINNLNRFF
tara:strand:- start:769 stop:1758 length:990 start_codon:yes stop_codon:yes gene_type:complete